MSVATLDDIPVIAAFLKRIGAEAVNFRAANVIQMVGGYPKVVGWVRFDPATGEVTASNANLLPSEEEAAAISAAIAEADFPKPVLLTAIADPPPGVNLSDKNVFVCHDFAGQIVMVHQRYQAKDGHKGFVPWTRWSDGQWRKMEPEVMPFYGLPGYQEASTLYIHEGSKAARRVKDMIEGEIDVDRFPWLDTMRWGHHIGWIGGVHALERSDWAKLSSLGWKRVVVVCDNDSLGKSILPDIARKFNCPVFAIVFTDDWPEAFDLGDDWPDHLFSEEGHYIGPTYEQCLQPATWATDEILLPPGPRGGRPQAIHTIRPVFAEQWSWIEEQDIMVNLDMPQYRMAAGRFNGFIRPFSHTRETLNLFQAHYTGNQMKLSYDPSKPGIIIRNSEGLQAVNLFQPSAIKPLPGDFSPWLAFTEYLFPVEEDRHEVHRWVATLRARPDIRMIYGLLMMSEKQGTGKGTFARILASLVGLHNASFPSAGLIVNSEFNGWASGKRLIIVDEIYEGHSWKAYNRLKPYVTDDSIEINVKHQATWSMPNWTHYVLMSNDRVALKLEKDDRRWLVPEVQEMAWSVAQFQDFHHWLRSGGIGHIAHWAHSFVDAGRGKWVRPGDKAPMSANKARLIEDSRSAAEQLFLQLAEAMREEGRPVAIPLVTIKPWAQGRLNGDRVHEIEARISSLLQSNGCWVTDRKKVAGSKQRLVVNKEAMLHWETGALRGAITSADRMFEEPL